MFTDLKDHYCECGQYLTTYMMIVGMATNTSAITMSGVPCPAKGCNRTYTIEKLPNDGMERTSKITTRPNSVQCKITQDFTNWREFAKENE